MSALIRHELPREHAAIFRVHQQAFKQDDESRLVDALRAQGHLRISLVAEVDGQVIGHIAFSELTIHTETSRLSALSLAPLAVLPEWQRQSVGAQLAMRGLDACRTAGHRAVIVLGDANYYCRFGFSTELALPLGSPYAGRHWMAIEFVPGALAGIAGQVEYPPPFAGL